MKQARLIALVSLLMTLSIFSVLNAATTYTWNGATAVWTAGTNWTPPRTTPATDDVLQFNNGATQTITGVTSQTIGQFLVSNNTKITLQPNVTATTLTIGGGDGDDLSVTAGSELNFSTPTNLTLIMTLTAAATASISGNMTFSGTSAVTAHRLTAGAIGAIVFNSGSIFTAGTRFNGNAFGTAAPYGAVIFGNGSTYYYTAGANPFGAAAPNSVLTFQTGSLYVHGGSSAPAYSGRSYANYEHNFANGFSATGGSVCNFDNLTITQCTTINLNLTGGINIRGNLAVNSGTLTFTPAIPVLPAVLLPLSFTGGSDQTISGAGTLTFGPNCSVVVSKTGTLILDRDVTIPTTLTLYNGAIDTNGHVLTVNGVVYETKAAATGTTGGAVLLDIPAVTHNLHVFDTAVQIDALEFGQTVLATPYWQPADVTLVNTGLVLMLTGSNLGGKTLTVTHSLGFTPAQIAYRLKNSSDAWGTWYMQTTGLNGTTATIVLPSAKSWGDVEIVFPTEGGQTLPVELSSFTATATADYFVQLNWTTQSETGVAGYYIYRNSNTDLDSAYRIPELIQATNTGSEANYTFVDNEVGNGLWYYWLENFDIDGQGNFHGPISVTLNNANGNTTPPVFPTVTMLKNIYPNPFNFTHTANIFYDLSKAGKVTLEVYNVKGEKVRVLVSESKDAGAWRTAWNGKNDNGKACSGGMYYIKMTSNETSATRKVVLVK